MIRRIINMFKGIPSCERHMYFLTDIMYHGKPGKSWSYRVACSNCRKVQWYNEMELRKRYQLGLVDLEMDEAIRIFGKGIEKTAPLNVTEDLK